MGLKLVRERGKKVFNTLICKGKLFIHAVKSIRTAAAQISVLVSWPSFPPVSLQPWRSQGCSALDPCLGEDSLWQDHQQACQSWCYSHSFLQMLTKSWCIFSHWPQQTEVCACFVLPLPLTVFASSQEGSAEQGINLYFPEGDKNFCWYQSA